MSTQQHLAALNQYNISSSNNSSNIKIKLTNNTLSLVNNLYSLGALSSYWISDIGGKENHIVISPVYFSSLPFYSSINLVSSPNKRFSVSYSALTLINTFSANSLLLVNSDNGICTLDECLGSNNGGELIAIFN